MKIIEQSGPDQELHLGDVRRIVEEADRLGLPDAAYVYAKVNERRFNNPVTRIEVEW